MNRTGLVLVNRSGSTEPNQFKINYIRALNGFFGHFLVSFSLFSLSRERGSALSVEFCHYRHLLPRRVGRFRRGGRRAIAAAPELKTPPFFDFFRSFHLFSLPLSNSLLKSSGQKVKLPRSRKNSNGFILFPFYLRFCDGF